MVLGKRGENSSSFFFFKRSRSFGRLPQMEHSLSNHSIPLGYHVWRTAGYWLHFQVVEHPKSPTCEQQHNPYYEKTEFQDQAHGSKAVRPTKPKISPCYLRLWARSQQAALGQVQPKNEASSQGSEWMRATAGQAGAGKDKWIPGTTSHLSDFPSHVEPRHWEAGIDGY